jgi:hypothetical protein
LGYQSDVNPYYEEILMFFFSFFSWIFWTLVLMTMLHKLPVVTQLE